MSPPIIAIARKLPGRIQLPAVAGGSGTVEAEFRVGGQDALPRDELVKLARGATILITWVSERVDAALLDAAGPTLKAVCNFAVGVDNIDLPACRARNIKVTNTPDAVTEGTADMAWTLLLATLRRLIPADRFARSPDYPRRGPLGPTEFVGLDLTGRTLLIVGAGRIGRAVAMRSIGWGMNVLYVARSRHWDFELAPLAAHRVSLDEGLQEADVVTIHTPLTSETRHLIGERQLSLLKPTAIIINTARGPIIDESALVRALKENRLYGAGLDVFEHEPKVHPELLTLDNAVLTPHIGSAAARYREAMTEMVLANAAAILEGRPPPNPVP
jgi:glyoxylate reductase